MPITVQQLKQVMPGVTLEHIGLYLTPLNDTMAKYGIGTPLRMAHFLAQIGHESLDLKYMEEIADGSHYEGRRDLGNVVKGDGKRFKGRGPMQITGRTNYRLYGKSIGVDLEAHPELLAQPPACIDSAGWFWSTHKLNDLADKDDVVAITKRINGGTTGLLQREARLLAAKKCFGVTS